MRQLHRSRSDRLSYGVLGGLANYLRLDSSFLRIIFIAGLFFSAGTLIFLYIASIFIIPDEWEG
ncbi:PspC domain-containing protein [Virgibacillus sp. W0430]|uniref:PspC domain-containing protein n=1 Tax=Virgibacillus sp. W0430 TaxID=3391580 RepID=UPI003F46869C